MVALNFHDLSIKEIIFLFSEFIEKNLLLPLMFIMGGVVYIYVCMTGMFIGKFAGNEFMRTSFLFPNCVFCVCMFLQHNTFEW